METPPTRPAPPAAPAKATVVSTGTHGLKWMSYGAAAPTATMDAFINPNISRSQLPTQPAAPTPKPGTKAALQAEFQSRSASLCAEIDEKNALLMTAAAELHRLKAALEEEKQERAAAEHRWEQRWEQHTQVQARAVAALVKHEVDHQLIPMRARVAEADKILNLPVAEVQPVMKRVRLNLQGVYSAVAPCKSISEFPIATKLPPGCMLIDCVVPDWALWQEQVALEKLLEDGTPQPIRAGQTDNKRIQLRRPADNLFIYNAYIQPALLGAGELRGREPIDEINIIKSLEGCKEQKMHWDFDPAHIAARPPGSRKPASAFLALEPGTRLRVRDADLGTDVQVIVPPGSMLIFEGDVLHAGMWYISSNLRVHVYLDVRGVKRTGGHVWLPGITI